MSYFLKKAFCQGARWILYLSWTFQRPPDRSTINTWTWQPNWSSRSRSATITPECVCFPIVWFYHSWKIARSIPGKTIHNVFSSLIELSRGISDSQKYSLSIKSKTTTKNGAFEVALVTFATEGNTQTVFNLKVTFFKQLNQRRATYMIQMSIYLKFSTGKKWVQIFYFLIHRPNHIIFLDLIFST